MTSPLDELRSTADEWWKHYLSTEKPEPPSDDEIRTLMASEREALDKWTAKEKAKEK